MNATKTVRRAAAALVAPALLLTAACGSEDGGDSGAAVSKVSGSFGSEPKVSAPKDAEVSDELVTETLTEGKGDTVKKGDLVRFDFVGKTIKDGKVIGSTWQRQPGADAKAPRPQMVHELGQPNQQLPDSVMNAMVGEKVGSRVGVEGTAKTIIGGEPNPKSGVKADDGLVFVLDIVGAKKVDKKAEVKGKQAAVESGLPEVKAESRKPAEITVPKGEKAPKDMKEQVLIKGDGPEVKAGEGLIAQYTGVKWEDGEMFDSSWKHGGATAFQIGTNSVIKGWDKGLVGKHVGDRVLLVIPPDQAYGGQQSELAKNNLVFVVDIVGTV